MEPFVSVARYLKSVLENGWWLFLQLLLFSPFSFWDSNYMYVSYFIHISWWSVRIILISCSAWTAWTIFCILIFFFLCSYLDVFCWHLFHFRKPHWTIFNLLLNLTIGFLFQLWYLHLILSHKFQISNKILHLWSIFLNIFLWKCLL